MRDRLFMNDNIIKEKTYQFALAIITFYRETSKYYHEYVISKQLLRSGTSIGANISESRGAQSRKDFLHKISIAYKEASERQYWLQLLKDSNIFDQHWETINKLWESIDEIIKILTKIIKTPKETTK